ncbi:MAG: hypothetical protein NZ696_02505 [Thermomicrobium sp.]|nr:hypothetical protein [Thermomicrobium sp.]MDW7982828.1 hypothetical protein [Thermomicrobium sp.]
MVMRPIIARSLAASLLGTGLLSVLVVIARAAPPAIGAVPFLAPEGRWFWLTATAVCLVGGLLFQLLDPVPQLAPATARRRGIRYDPVTEWPTGWVLPFLTLAVGALLLCAYHTELAGMAIALLGFVALFLGQLARIALYSGEPRVRALARVAHTVLVYGLAFAAFAMVYVHKLRSLYSATALFLFASIAFLQLTEGEDIQLDRRILYAMTGGLVLAEATWVLNYWPATGWIGGAALLAVFHFLAGLLLARSERTLSWRTALEYGSTTALALAVIVWGMLRTRGGL